MADNERARLRAIMYEPATVWLCTAQGGSRYLTDQYVLLDVTEAQVTRGVNDGPYQLMSSGEWRMEERDSVPPPDVTAYLALMSRKSWRPATPTQWSVAEDPDVKRPSMAMLWSVEADMYLVIPAQPALMGESTWVSIKRHYPDVAVEWAPNESAGVFRFSAPVHLQDESCEEGECDCPEMPFAYAAGIRIPDGQEKVAKAIVDESWEYPDAA